MKTLGKVKKNWHGLILCSQFLNENYFGQFVSIIFITGFVILVLYSIQKDINKI